MNTAIVGCGAIAPLHAAAVAEMPGAVLVAAADTQIARAEAIAGQYGANSYNSLEEMLVSEKIEVLHICTPHYLHVPMIRYAVERGIHVFSEKPPVINAQQLEELLSLERSSRIGFCFQNRYNHSVLAVRELLQSGAAGAVTCARAFVSWSRDAAYYTESGWRGKLSTEGGGVLINQAIHTLDLLMQFLGRPVSWESAISNRHLKDCTEVEDTLEAYLDFSGIPVLLHATTAYQDNTPVLLELSCEKVRIRIEEEQVVYYWRDGRTQTHNGFDTITRGKRYWGSSHAACIQAFYAAVLSGNCFAEGVAGIRDTAELLLELYQSAGQPEFIPKGWNPETE